MAIRYPAADTQEDTSPMTIGTLSSRTGELLGIDAPLDQGNSGGPLLDAMGCVIGVNTGRISIEGISFAAPINDVDYRMDANEGPCVPVTVPAWATAPTTPPTVAPKPTATPTPTPALTATPTSLPTYTPFPTATATPTPRPTATPTPWPTPTLTPTATPTPRPTRVPWVLREAKYADPEYTISVPSVWSGGRVTFFAKEHSSTPASWVQRNTIRGAYRYDISSLGDAGVKLVGTYFKERYSSDELCGERGFVVIRESALALDYRYVGVAVHVDVCEAGLYLEAEPGITNEAISRRIIGSLYQKN